MRASGKARAHKETNQTPCMGGLQGMRVRNRHPKGRGNHAQVEKEERRRKRGYIQIDPPIACV